MKNRGLKLTTSTTNALLRLGIKIDVVNRGLKLIDSLDHSSIGTSGKGRRDELRTETRQGFDLSVRPL